MALEKDSLQRIIENLHDGLYIVDKDRTITYWNKAAERISGFSSKEVVGKSCAHNILTHVDRDGNCLCSGICPLAGTIKDGRPREADVYMHHRDGHRIPVSVRVNPMTDDQGCITGGIELFTDISNRMASELRVEELKALAMLDPLTRLANRAGIDQELRRRFDGRQQYDVPFGILFMDIDYFKRFNDTYGHDVGDRVLRFVARTFVSNARPFDFYGRWGGEEFMGIIRNVGPLDLRKAGERIRSLIAESYILEGRRRLSVTISLGATMAGEADTPAGLVKRADRLMYESKNSGRNRMTFG